MKYLFCIYDNFLDEYLPPYVSKNDKMAILSYDTYLKNNPLLPGQETKLFCCGQFDELLGNCSPLESVAGKRLIKEYKNSEVKENG